MSIDAFRCRQAGITLVETIMFIVIVGVGVAGLAAVMNSTLKYSADPMLRKQAIAAAESLLEEIMLQPFTACDPDAWDPAATPPCQMPEAMGPETAGAVPEARGPLAAAPFDNVNDYHGFRMADGILSIGDGSVVPGLENYAAAVAVTEVGDRFGADAAHALKINVTVTDPRGEQVTLTGYRFRFSDEPAP